jgi:hypothetical protein
MITANKTHMGYRPEVIERIATVSANICISVCLSEVTARIQECHILAGHIVSGYCERVLGRSAVHNSMEG